MQSALNLPMPPPELQALSHTLGERIVAWIEAHGPMPFDRYMQMCLYEPGLGYYVNGLHKFGVEGDFITAPEQGALFSKALAWQFDALAESWGEDWILLELGAGSGILAKDLLNALAQPPHRYQILEPSAALRDVQAQTLDSSTYLDRVEWLDEPPSTPFRGVVLANEVIDALPIKRFRMGPSGMEELAVTIDTSSMRTRFNWTTIAPDKRLKASVNDLQSHLPKPLPIGYESECLVDLAPWIKTVTEALTEGVAIFIDYGYDAKAYYHPDRSEGTLVCHYRHRAHFDPFVWPGLTDLSAFVDFSRLATCANEASLAVAGFTTQAEFVLASGIHEQVIHEPDELMRLKQLAELKRLTLPGEMGEKFKMMALSRGVISPMAGFSGSIEP